MCNNTIGSYRCECSTGFVADDCGPQNPQYPVCVGKKLINCVYSNSVGGNGRMVI